MKQLFPLLTALVLLLCLLACKTHAPGHRLDEPEAPATVNYLEDIEPLNPDSTVNVVIEISAGSIEKWEVDKATGTLVSDTLDGKPRKVAYLPYPGNYGMVPKTLLSEEDGGDGDPIDVMVLGPAIPRGAVAACKIIGVLKLIDSGEVDSKLIGVAQGSPFSEVDDLAALEQAFPGVEEIMEIWFTNYKGPGLTRSEGYAEKELAEEMLFKAIKTYKNSH